MKTLTELQIELANYQINAGHCDDRLAHRCCELALEALANGCYGVGAILLDTTDNTLVEGRNEVFLNGFHSARHAEMVVLDKFEEKFPQYRNRGELTMLVTLEPCPMCLTRLLFAGIGRVLFLAEDPNGGMVHLLNKMPEVWQNLALLQKQHRADISPALSSLATEIAICRLKQLRAKLLQAIRP